MIVLAAITIIVTSVREWLSGLQLENLGVGSLLILGGWSLERSPGAILAENRTSSPFHHSGSQW